MNVDYAKLRHALAEAPKRGTRKPPDHRQASVCLPLFDRTETLVLAIRKTDTAGYLWRNQIALPGGFVDATDASETHTALRELNEELGIPPSDMEVLGELGRFQTATSRALVAATVARWRPGRPLAPEPREVAEVLTIPLGDLVAAHVSGGLDGHDTSGIAAAISYRTADGRIWGLTARILHSFLELLIRSRSVSLASW